MKEEEEEKKEWRRRRTKRGKKDWEKAKETKDEEEGEDVSFLKNKRKFFHTMFYLILLSLKNFRYLTSHVKDIPPIKL